jgi:hypothetical protein
MIFGTLKKLATITRNILITCAVFVTIISLFSYFTSTHTTKNTTDSYQQYRESLYNNINNKQLNSTKQGHAVVLIYRAALCNFIGEGCTTDPTDADKHFNKSLFGMMTSAITLPYQSPPASFAYWFKDGLENAGFVPKSYAAEGIGFSSIKGYRSIWSIFRNLSYLILVVVIVAIGFMIMFRMKINPQTVVSVENALPRIVTTLIYITFSFAIAGFLIDLMYVMIAVVISVLSQLNIGSLRPENIQMHINEYMMAGFGGIWPYDKVYLEGSGPVGAGAKLAGSTLGPAFSTGSAFFNVLPDVIKLPFKTIITFAVGNMITKGLLTDNLNNFFKALTNISAAGFSIGNIPLLLGVIIQIAVFYIISGYVPGLILGLLILLSILKLLFDIFVLILSSYITIILLVIFSPIYLLMEAIPGRDTFKNWWMSLLGELLTFPLIILFTLTGYAVVIIHHTGQVFTLPFFYGFSSEDVSTLVGMAIILMIPQLVQLVKSSLGIKPMPLNVGAQTFFGGAAALGTMTGMVGGGFPTLLRGFSPTIKGLFKDKPLGGVVSEAIDFATEAGRYKKFHTEGSERATPIAVGQQGPKETKG